MDERPGETGGGGDEGREQSREGAPREPDRQQRTPERGRAGGGGDERGRRERDPRRRPQQQQQRERGGREGQPQHTQSAQQQQQQRSDASLDMDELRELFDLFTAQGFTEFELEKEGFRIRLRRDFSQPAGAGGAQGLSAVPPAAQSAQVLPFVAPSAEAQPAATAQAAAAAKAEAAASAEADLHVITSPIVGTFYRAASPTTDPFVRAGSHVEHDSVVCIIEAMKLMNEIQAETTGTVEKIYVENGQPVEYGQPLFGIKK